MNAPERLPAILADLIATRDSSQPEDEPATHPERRRRRRRRRTRPFAGEQRSLFGEVLDWMFAPLLLVWPLSVAVTFVVARSLADAPFDRALTDRVRVLAEQVQQQLRQPSAAAALVLPSAARAMLRADDGDMIVYQVMGADNELLLGDRGLPAPALYDFPAPGVIKLRDGEYHGVDVRVGYEYVERRDAPDATPVLVQVAETQEKRTRLANEIIKGVIFPQFLILPLAVGLVWFGLSRGLAPLKSMQQRIHDRDPEDLSPIDPAGAPAEISPLVDAFNELLERLGQSMGAQRRLIADAAHQMKTPLAGLRTHAELALRETDPAEVRRSLEQLVRGSERAAHLIKQLLSLARMENLRDRAELHAMDLNPLARSVVTEWADVALSRDIDFGFETDDVPAPIVGHPVLLRELFANLIDNALRYTPSGGTVTARVRSDREHVVFEVEDDGPGIPEAERELVFERFYRVLGTQADGSGLGLAIVREIAREHDARVTLVDASPGRTPPGTRAIVEFPRTVENLV